MNNLVLTPLVHLSLTSNPTAIIKALNNELDLCRLKWIESQSSSKIENLFSFSLVVVEKLKVGKMNFQTSSTTFCSGKAEINTKIVLQILLCFCYFLLLSKPDKFRCQLFFSCIIDEANMKHFIGF